MTQEKTGLRPIDQDQEQGQAIVLSPNIAVKDFTMDASSKMLENYKSIFDASLVQALRGDYSFYQGTMPEFGLGQGTFNIGQEALALGGLGIMTDSSGQAAYEAKEAGLYGLSISYGLVSRYGLIPLASSIDTVAILAKDLEDLSRVFEKIATKDPKDSASTGHDIMAKRGENLENLPIGKVEDLNLDLALSPSIYDILSAGEFATNMQKFDGISLGYRSPNYESIDDIYKNSRSEGLGQEVKDAIMFGNFVLLDENYQAYYDQALRARTFIIEEFDRAFETTSFLSAPIEEAYLIGAKLAGLPYLYLPKTERILIGRAFTDNNLIDLGEVVD